MRAGGGEQLPKERLTALKQNQSDRNKQSVISLGNARMQFCF